MELTGVLFILTLISGPGAVIFLLIYNIRKKLLNAYDVLSLLLPFVCWVFTSIFVIAGSHFKVQTLANAVFEPLSIGIFITMAFGASTLLRQKFPGKKVSAIFLMLSCLVAIGVAFAVPTIRE
ncbi:MAG: hypothetical protein J0L53_07815 [Spirochaetes bacterium]|nr:hypothetical protein [Spirochaetota bacterium]MBX3723351.1 hypothetical protein [Turneriella sp.]